MISKSCRERDCHTELMEKLMALLTTHIFALTMQCADDVGIHTHLFSVRSICKYTYKHTLEMEFLV